MQNTTTFFTFTIVFVLAIFGGIAYQHGGIDHKNATSVVTQFFGPTSAINKELVWPPRLGEAYPDLELTDLSGDKVRLSDFRGRVLIIEPIGMSCKACQAFAGGHIVGGFDGHKPQPKVESLDEYFRAYTGLKLSDERLQLIQILFYGPSGRKAPTVEDARRWAKHFGPALPSNTIILCGDRSLISSETKAMIPGVQLVDRDFILRCDAGNPPRQNPYLELLPMVRTVLNP